jgi:ABC-type polysaccharide/polyol phosphate export permease
MKSGATSDLTTLPPPEIDLASSLNPRSARDLLFNLVRAELTSRYKAPVFGLLWFLVSPALMTAVLMVVFRGFIPLSIERYPVFLLAGLLPWTFFQQSLAASASSLTRAPAIVKRVRIPRALVPLSAVLSTLVHLLVSLALLLGVLVVLGQAPGVVAVLCLVPIVLIEALFVTGLGLAAAGLNVYYRDVEHLIESALRLGFWVTPIFYPLAHVPERLQGLLTINPLTSMLEAYRAVLVNGDVPEFASLGIAAILAAVAVGVGVRQVERHGMSSVFR